MSSVAARPGATKTIVLADLWRRFKRTGDQKARNELILAYSPIVKYAAGRIVSRMPAHVDVADLVSYGLGGLIDAVDRFEEIRAGRSYRQEFRVHPDHRGRAGA